VHESERVGDGDPATGSARRERPCFEVALEARDELRLRPLPEFPHFAADGYDDARVVRHERVSPHARRAAAAGSGAEAHHELSRGGIDHSHLAVLAERRKMSVVAAPRHARRTGRARRGAQHDLAPVEVDDADFVRPRRDREPPSARRHRGFVGERGQLARTERQTFEPRVD